MLTTRFRRLPRRAMTGLVAVILLFGAWTGVADPALAASSASGCTVHAWYPNYSYGQWHYHGWVSCKSGHPAYGLLIYIGNEWFKPGHSTDSWENHKTHDCGGGGNKYYCAVSSSGPSLGAGKYCTVAIADLYFDSRISVRMCTTAG